MQRTYTTIITITLLGVGLVVTAETGTNSEEAALRNNVTEEMNLITKSLEDLLGELAIIKREATGRLVKNRVSTNDAERIRQTKLSRYVLKRVAELELQSQGMKDDLVKLFSVKKSQLVDTSSISVEPPTSLFNNNVNQFRQEDVDFEEPTTARQQSSASPASEPSSLQTSTLKPDEEVAKIGFDIEALKKLGDQLESEIEARQAQTPESVRGVHEQVIKLVDNMVNTYLGNVRRAVQRMTNLLDNTRAGRPRESPTGSQDSENFYSTRQALLTDMDTLQANFREFSTQWLSLTGRQQSPLIDRIPPRGVELWRDFWDTVRRQVRRINAEFVQISRDMGRMITGRLPSTRLPATETHQPFMGYSAAESDSLIKQSQSLLEKLSAEKQKLDGLAKVQYVMAGNEEAPQRPDSNLYDEQDDEVTRNELNRNPALRQQIQQEINIFGSIFDIMGAFITRLRESASNAVRGVIQPNSSINNNNDAVTPGPSVKPTVDQLLGETINSQRNINSQAKPVLLPNNRPSLANRP